MGSKKLVIAIFLFIATVIPSYAGVVVNAPGNSSTVSSPFNLSAYASTCSSQQVTAMGYSLDSSTSTTIVKSSSISTSVSAASGGHTLHVKAWGSSGASCVTDVSITVSTSSVVPSNASSVSSLQAMGGWSAVHDKGTPGSSSGWTGTTSSPSKSGAARKFQMSYSYYGGERYSISFGDDESATNFLYDTWVYIPSPSTGLANLEMDLNQVLSNGATVIYGMQCDGWSGTWDVTVNKGSASKPIDQWVHTGAKCNPHSWSTNTWHHVQFSYSRNDTGWITYKSVTFDGTKQSINLTALGAFNLGWGPTLLANIQLDGATSGSGSASIIMDDLVIYRW